MRSAKDVCILADRPRYDPLFVKWEGQEVKLDDNSIRFHLWGEIHGPVDLDEETGLCASLIAECKNFRSRWADAVMEEETKQRKSGKSIEEITSWLCDVVAHENSLRPLCTRTGRGQLAFAKLKGIDVLGVHFRYLPLSVNSKNEAVKVKQETTSADPETKNSLDAVIGNLKRITLKNPEWDQSIREKLFEAITMYETLGRALLVVYWACKALCSAVEGFFSRDQLPAREKILEVEEFRGYLSNLLDLVKDDLNGLTQSAPPRT